MSKEEYKDPLQHVADIAALAGIKGRIDEKRNWFTAGFNMDEEGRTQQVVVRLAGRSPGGQQIVSFFSPCRRLKTGFMRGLSKEEAVELLCMNEKIPFARFGLQRFEDDDYDMIVASVDHLLATLDAKEFEEHIWAVAHVADRYEKEHGGDAF